MNTCSYLSWTFRCMMKNVTRLPPRLKTRIILQYSLKCIGTNTRENMADFSGIDTLLSFWPRHYHQQAAFLDSIPVSKSCHFRQSALSENIASNLTFLEVWQTHSGEILAQSSREVPSRAAARAQCVGELELNDRPLASTYLRSGADRWL